MVITQALKSAKFVVDDNGKKSAVLLDIQNWEVILDWIENISDTKIAMNALKELKDAGGRPQAAGWLDWQDVREEWGEKEKDYEDLEQLLADLKTE
ncbi:MAG: hypothetical protein ACE5I1_11490 [bacterium]